MIRAHTQNRKHDLPPRWDGVGVDWTEWNVERTTLIHHMRPEQVACRKCGLIDESLTSIGRLRVDGGGRGMPALFVSRCRGCVHDVVLDLRSDESWDLEDSDYDDDGSRSDALW